MLETACTFDRAGAVAEEKLFEPGPASAPGPGSPPPALVKPLAFGAWDETALVGVAACASRWLRVLAVVPAARRRGFGSALLAACETAARSAGETRMSALDQPGNYLAPGIDERNVESIAWLERRGWARKPEVRMNVLIDVRGNERVSIERAARAAEKATERGYEIRRARRDETALLAAVASEFGGAWPFELERALAYEPAGVHVAMKDGTYCAFAAHDGNNQGAGWFGPTGTWPAHRGQGLGEALLLACLVDVGTAHSRCEIAWIGPRPFYEKVAGVASERRFVVIGRQLT
ncbi:MAG: GCN5-related N-acetyltransferase [Myxococcales bacterium]|nr:GCN5-related N-acetyltransferase [Myxococcales bacterium]